MHVESGACAGYFKKRLRMARRTWMPVEALLHADPRARERSARAMLQMYISHHLNTGAAGEAFLRAGLWSCVKHVHDARLACKAGEDG